MTTWARKGVSRSCRSSSNEKRSPSAVPDSFERQRQHRGAGAGNAGNAGPAILAQGSDFGAGGTQLERGEPARQDAVDPGAGERQVDCPQLEKRVSEADEAVPFAMGESADGDGAEIAAHERDPQRRSRLHRAGIISSGLSPRQPARRRLRSRIRP